MWTGAQYMPQVIKPLETVAVRNTRHDDQVTSVGTYDILGVACEGANSAHVAKYPRRYRYDD